MAEQQSADFPLSLIATIPYKLSVLRLSAFIFRFLLVFLMVGMAPASATFSSPTEAISDFTYDN